MRLINADDLLDRVWRGRVGSRELVMQLIREAPTVFEKDDPKRGEWGHDCYVQADGDETWFVYCSECETEFDEDAVEWNYCPNCGARMEE